MRDELGNIASIDDENGKQVSFGALARMEKRKKEQEEHKKRIAALKAKKKVGASRPRFDRSKISSAFMNNAKNAKDDAKGWALDLANDSQNVV